MQTYNKWSAHLTFQSLAAAVALAGLVAPACAADWVPTSETTIVVHTNPGSSIDLFARTVANIWVKHKLAPNRAVVQNVPGAGGLQALHYVALDKKGDASIMLGLTPATINRPILRRSDLTYRRLTPLAIMAVEPMVLYVNAQSPFRHMKDILDAARTGKRPILQGGGAFGGPPSLAGKMLADEFGIKLSYVPFKGSGDAVLALLGQHVDFIMEQPVEAEEQVKAGKLRPLAQSVKVAIYPNLPTFAELGYKFRIFKQYRGLMAAPGVAPEVQGFYLSVLERVRKTPEWKHYLDSAGIVDDWIAGSRLAAFLAEESDLYGKVDHQLGLIKKK